MLVDPKRDYKYCCIITDFSLCHQNAQCASTSHGNSWKHQWAFTTLTEQQNRASWHLVSSMWVYPCEYDLTEEFCTKYTTKQVMSAPLILLVCIECIIPVIHNWKKDTVSSIGVIWGDGQRLCTQSSRRIHPKERH